MRQEPYVLHWFRRDLRVRGNPALEWSHRRGQGRVVGLFIFDRKFLARPDFSHHRFAFFLQSLRALREELRAAGSDLLVIDDQPAEGLRSILKAARPAAISFNRDYEPFARARDAQIEELLRTEGIELHTAADHLVVEPEEAMKKDGTPYKVFTPFYRRWREVLESPAKSERLSFRSRSLSFDATWKGLGVRREDALESFIEENAKHVTIEIPDAGAAAGTALIKRFRAKVDSYGAHRDLPSVEGTSRFAMYLKNGSITTAQIIASLDLLAAKRNSGADQFLRQLAWREFYYQILYHFPHVEKEEFIAKFRGLHWENDRKLFARWCAGTTGFPIIDAGMRELATTGWMHNRVRMIVASFLTKDLLIDWRWGEKHFMEKLLDGDLAANNGGWQWAASTGCDPQPYFRIFNPWLQGKKFDPEGEYIRRFVPELRDIPRKELHLPEGNRGKAYPAPIVDHAAQKRKALGLYSS